MTKETESALAVLQDRRASLAEVMSAITLLEARSGWTGRLSIGISSNVTLNLMDVFVRRHGYLHDVDITVHSGGYDDHLGDIETFLNEGVEQLFLLSFFDNLMPSFEAQVQHLPMPLIEAKQHECLGRLGVALDAAKPFKNVFLARFHRYSSPASGATEDKLDRVIHQFNAALEELAAGYSNVTRIDTAASIASIGYENAFDDRFYAQARAPYSSRALDQIATNLALATRGFGSYFYKAIVLDCDDTLWGGLIGEERVDGIRLDPFDAPGNIFWRIQNELLGLEQRGTLICLCSKNNPEDVQQVLEDHPHMLLKPEHITVMKINWNDKVSNLVEIAQELNIGLDSLVFIDDSDFECQLVRDQLPMVRTIQVPKTLSDYPRVFEGLRSLFGNGADGQSATALYRIRSAANQEVAKFASHEDYLRSLGLEVTLTRDDKTAIARISELALKSNQFNLTTQRYSSGDIERMMQAPEYAVYSFCLQDKFGSHGLTGVLVAHFESATVKIEAFLMSCRIIGRGVEFSIWQQVLAEAIKNGCTHIEASYIPTPKNGQVSDFYERLGLAVSGQDEQQAKHYRSALENLAITSNDWIKVSHD